MKNIVLVEDDEIAPRADAPPARSAAPNINLDPVFAER